MTRIAGQDQPAEIVGIVAADELVVHGWDVARATGQPYSAEPELLDAAQTFLGFFASPDAPSRDPRSPSARRGRWPTARRSWTGWPGAWPRAWLPPRTQQTR